MRTPFQGVYNIVRFNWHFYTIAFVTLLIAFLASYYVSDVLGRFIYVGCIFTITTICISLVVSYYVYDASNLYDLSWLDTEKEGQTIININAGFDETSALLHHKFPTSHLIVLDFYDSKEHTEISIQRARKAYPPYPNTKQITTTNTGLESNSADCICLTLAAHEIRNPEERVAFFMELKRILKPSGTIYVTEHLRDAPNFLAYIIGFLHFYSKKNWLHTFAQAQLTMEKQTKTTSFISHFKLVKHGSTS